ncbi:uncharacterized protein LOC112092526 [Morus notabilis]|uniref:uncharacterized protein LOC112092526 n=1 Tax=Morus notabilis TaxID=981085 RepID=UPI000CED385B|nr:uncharacterized protein LOC112092526 [Morus notabilis]
MPLVVRLHQRQFHNQFRLFLSLTIPSNHHSQIEWKELPFPAVSFSDHSLQITIQKLNGKNYLEWSQFVRLVIDGKGKLGHLNGEVKPPATNDPKYRQWRSENSLVTDWLINSMDPVVGKPFMFLPTTRDVWEAVRETYSDLDNHSELFELNTRMWKMQQGDCEVTAYYNDMMTVWQELDMFEDEQWENSNDSARYKKKIERGRVFVFLADLNKELDEV